MPSFMNSLFVVVFGGCALYGFVTVVSQTRKIRARRPYEGVLFEWAEPPGTSFREDFPTWLAINIHRGTVILLGLAALLMLIFQRIDGIAPANWPPVTAFLYGPVLLGVVAMNGFFFGFMTGGPLADRMGRNRHYAVSEAGVLAVGRLEPWDMLSHITLDRERGAVRIWSRSLPGTIAFAFHPPAERWNTLLGVLQAHLPVREEPSGAQRYGLALRMALLCAPFVAAGIFLCWLPSAGALMTLAALMGLVVLVWLLLMLGSTLIMRWVYGGKGKAAGGVNGEW